MPGELSFVTLAIPLMCQPAGEAVTPAEVAALANRRRVQTIHVVTRREMYLPAIAPHPWSVESEYWLDGEKLRADHVNHNPTTGSASGRREVECRNCQRTGYNLYYRVADRAVSTLTPAAQDHLFPLEATFDPRLLGFSPNEFGLLRKGRLDGLVGSPARKNTRTKAVTVDGSPCVVVRFDLPSGAVQHAIWLDPARGHHPVRFEAHIPDQRGGPALLGTAVITPQPVGDGMWFPKRIEVTGAVGGEVTTRETADILTVEVNRPIPPEVFTLGGIRVAENAFFTVVGDRDRVQVWRGGKLVPYSQVVAEAEAAGTAVQPVPVPLDQPVTGRPWGWYLAAGAFLAVAVGLVLRGRSH